MSVTISGTGAITGVSTNYSFDKKVSIGGSVGFGSTALDVGGDINITDPNGTGTGGLYIGDGTTDSRGLIVSNHNRPETDVNLLGLISRWANNQVASILFQTGSDTVNKKEGYIIFRTRNGGGGGIPTRMTLTKEGYLGIGNSGPSTKLTIDHTTPIKTSNSAAAGELGNVYLEMSSGGTQAIGNLGPSINFTGINQSGINGRKAAIIAQQTGSNSSQVGLSFWTNNTSDSGGVIQQRSIITSSGNFGIGTSSPSTKLEVADSSPATITLKSTNSIVTPEAELQAINFYQSDTTGGAGISARIVGVGNNLSGAQNLTFHTGQAGLSNVVERMRITSSGDVRLSNPTASPSLGSNTEGIQVTGGTLVVNSAGSGNVFGRNNNGAVLFFQRNGTSVGTITVSTTNTAYNTSSDYRLKENVVDLDGAIDRVKQLAPKRFNFIADADTTVDGFLAHEAQTVVPEAVTGTHNEVDDDGNAVMQGIDQSKLVPLLTAALQEAIAKIETLETKVAALEGN